MITYIPLYYTDYLGGSPVYASYILAVFMMAGVMGTYISGTLSDRFGRKTVLIVSMILSFPLLNLFPYTTGFATILLVAITGFTLISSFATTTVLAQEMMPGMEALAASLTIGFSIGLGGVGAALLGYIADHFGVPSVFIVVAILPIGAIILAFSLPGKLLSPDSSVVEGQ